jgi:hopanoid biosynthesis associated RND transporter like protein HpnN
VLDFLVAVVETCRKRAWAVLLAAVLLVGASLWYTAGHLGLDTDTDDLISPNLPWQQQSRAFDRAFPLGTSQTVVVIDGKSADAVTDGTARLATALAKRTDLFKSVRRPDGGPFFDTYGLLFLSEKELNDLSNQLAAAQPLLGPLDTDPTLRGLFGVLDQALTGFDGGQATGEKLRVPMRQFAKTIEAEAAARPAALDWGSMMTGQPPRPEELRHFILVQPKLDFSALEPGAAASAAIRATAAQLGLEKSGLTVRLTGEVPLEDDEFSSITEGAGVTTTVSLLGVLIILSLGLRAPRLILSIIVTLIAGLIVTAGYAALAVGSLNLISVAFAVLFIGIGVDFGIQFSMRYRAELHEVAGGTLAADRRAAHAEAIRRTARGIAGPLGLAALSTCIGFFSFLPTDYRGVSELGLIAGTSMLIALVANLTLLPAILTLLPSGGRPEAAGFTWAAPIDRWLARHARAVLAVAVLLGVAGAASIPLVRFDADPLDLKDPHKESVQTARALMRDPLASPYTIEVLTPDEKAAEALAAKVSTLPLVKQALTLSSFVPEDQPAKLDILQTTQLLLGPVLQHLTTAPAPTPAEERASLVHFTQHLQSFLAGSKAGQLGDAGPALLAALKAFQAAPGGGDVVALRQALLGGFEQRMDILRRALQATPLTLAGLPQDIREDWISVDGHSARVSIAPTGDMRDERQMAAFVTAIRAVAPDATGAPVTILESGRTVSHAFVTASLLAIAAIMVVLALILRRLVDVLLVLIPLVLAGFYALGTCALAGIAFNYANVIAVPLLLGIGVAFDIYFVMAWRRSRGEAALLQTSTARAVVFSAGTTASAFGALMLSHHVGTASMGLILVLSLFYVLVATLIVQPALMTLWRRRD